MKYDFGNHILAYEHATGEMRSLDLNLSTAIEGGDYQTIIWFGSQSFLIEIPYWEVVGMWEQAKRWYQS